MAHNDPAGNFLAGIAGGLRGKIVGTRVDDHGFPQDFFHRKTVRQEGRKRIAVVAPQRQQVTDMFRMPASVRIVMRPGICKSILRGFGAGAAVVDMKRKDLLSAVCRPPRQKVTAQSAMTFFGPSVEIRIEWCMF